MRRPHLAPTRAAAAPPRSRPGRRPARRSRPRASRTMRAASLLVAEHEHRPPRREVLEQLVRRHAAHRRPRGDHEQAVGRALQRERLGPLERCRPSAPARRAARRRAARAPRPSSGRRTRPRAARPPRASARAARRDRRAACAASGRTRRPRPVWTSECRPGVEHAVERRRALRRLLRVEAVRDDPRPRDPGARARSSAIGAVTATTRSARASTARSSARSAASCRPVGQARARRVERPAVAQVGDPRDARRAAARARSRCADCGGEVVITQSKRALAGERERARQREREPADQPEVGHHDRLERARLAGGRLLAPLDRLEVPATPVQAARQHVARAHQPRGARPSRRGRTRAT